MFSEPACRKPWYEYIEILMCIGVSEGDVTICRAHGRILLTY
jgi:hypothetical protein